MNEPAVPNESTPRRFPKRFFIEAAKFLVAAGVVAAAAALIFGRLSYNWQWYRVPRYIIENDPEGIRAGLLLRGLGVTLKISGISLLLSAGIGLATAVFRLSRSFTANLVAQVYLEAIRNTPLLIQLFFVYFVLSPILGISRFMSAVLALSLFEGAYASEIIRGGILSVHRGQWESAHSLGLGFFDSYWFVVLPQAVRKILPALASQAISLIKDSALVSTIAVYDLAMRGSTIVSETFLTFEVWFTVAAIYLIITVTLSVLVSLMEKKVRSTP